MSVSQLGVIEIRPHEKLKRKVLNEILIALESHHCTEPKQFCPNLDYMTDL